jgi:sugar/nucleoside kinase (ribokinase family)
MDLAPLLAEHLPRRRLRALLCGFGGLHLGVVGDYFLDAYYDCAPELNEPSLETGRNCYQVVQTRRQAGAAGTVAANLVALGVGRVDAVGFCGDDGEGFELRRAMLRLGLNLEGFQTCAERFTPTYGKPTYIEGRGSAARVTEELERLDISNRRRTPAAVQDTLIQAIDEGSRQWQGIILVDQVNQANCGVLTSRIRRLICEQLASTPGRAILADSRQRIASFRNVILKPNQMEATALSGSATGAADSAPLQTSEAEDTARALTRRSQRPVFLTLGAEGLVAADQHGSQRLPAVAVPPPVDTVGAGDSTSAALVAALAAGATVAEAGLLAVLTASITVQQLGTTGTATPSQLLRRHREVLDEN